jgi:hypothetical protein
MRMKLLFAIFWKGMQMDIKFAHISNALAKLKDEIGSEAVKNLTMEVTLIQDDPGSGRMIECLTFKGTVVTPPGKYDSFKGDVNKEYTLEIFSSGENRSPRFILTASRDLEKNEDGI